MGHSPFAVRNYRVAMGESPPVAGEVRAGRCITGKKVWARNTRFQWLLCPQCGRGRWVQVTRIRAQKWKTGGLCIWCSCTRNSVNSPSYKDGRVSDGRGNIRIRLWEPDPFFSMATSDSRHDSSGRVGGYIPEHRLVMAQHLGRCLESWEVVHHINGVKGDNRLENLELLPGAHRHAPFNILQYENQRLREEVGELQTKIAELEVERLLGSLDKTIALDLVRKGRI